MTNELTGKLPPQAIDVEESVLGAMLLEKKALLALGNLTADEFYKEQHQEVFNAIKSLDLRSEPVDVKTVTHELKSRGKLEKVGGAYAVSILTAKINSSANIETHCKILQAQATKRKLITFAADLYNKAYEDTQNADELLSKADRDFTAISTKTGSSIVNLGEKLNELIDDVVANKKQKEEGQIVGTPTGIQAIDMQTGGLRNSDLVVIAARPGQGKTALVGTMMKNQAVDFGIPVGLLSMEMSWRQIGTRILAQTAEINQAKLRDGVITSSEIEEMVLRAGPLSNSGIYIDDTPALTVHQIKSKARIMVRQHGIKVLYVDYLQLADADGVNREREISRISGACKAIAKELEIPVVALSQLSRAVESRSDKRPQLSDLRDSGSIEQDADMVWFLMRPEYYGIEEDENGMPFGGRSLIDIAKFRNGSTAEVWVKFVGKFGLWKDNEEPVRAVNDYEPF